MQVDYSDHVTSPAAFLARRHRLSLHVADVFAQLAGLGRVDAWRPLGEIAAPTILRAAAARATKRRVA